jgi:transposase
METIEYRPGIALSESEGFKVIESYQSSGLSAKAFAKSLGMGEKTFYKWHHRYLRH